MVGLQNTTPNHQATSVRTRLRASGGAESFKAERSWKKAKMLSGEKIAKKTMNFSSIVYAECLNSRAQGKMDNIIEAKELQIERKHFYVELRENDRGKFLRITEEAHGRRNSIIVPSTGVDDFTAAISEVLTNNGSAPL